MTVFSVRRICIPFVFVAVCAGCSGGSSPIQTANPTPTMTPTATPSALNLNGATFTYARTATADGYVTGLTCLSPQTAPTETTRATISQQVKTGQTYDGKSNLVAVTSNVSMQGCADGTEPTVETDYFATPAPNGSGPSLLVLVGSTVSYSNANAIVSGTNENVTIDYGPSGRVVDEFPSSPGRTWSNPATLNSKLQYVNGSYQFSSAVAADGSYRVDGVNLGADFPYEATTVIENSDGSGSQTTVEGANASAAPYVVSLSAPTSGNVILSDSGSLPNPPLAPTPMACPTAATPCPAVVQTPYPQHAWYPYTPSASRPLETISSVDRGPTTLPTSCALSSAYPTSADLVETSDATLDVWFGTKLTVSDAYVDPTDGLLCLRVSSQQATYSFGPTSADATPVGTDALEYTEVLQNEHLPSSSLRRPSALHADAAGGTLAVRAAAFALADFAQTRNRHFRTAAPWPTH